MPAASLAPHEDERLKALRAYGILDTGPEQAFEDIVSLLAEAFEAPIALVNLIESDRAWFKASVGTSGMTGSSREVSFCAHSIASGRDQLVVPDATTDARFADNPLVTGEPQLRFYAGHVLRTPEGHALGALCVHDIKARPDGITPLQSRMLEVLAGQVMAQFELRRAVKEREEGVKALAESESKFRAIADSMPQMVWSTLPDGFHDYYNARWYEFTGVPPGSTDGEGWNGMFHPEDQERAWARWQHSLQTGELYEIEYRLRRHDGVYRWTLGRAQPIRDEHGSITRWFGTCTDIDDLKRMEQGKELLSQELSHRIKNIFAVVSALIALSAREHPEARAFASAVRNRINALARAHEFVRPHSEVSKPTVGDTTLHTFLGALFRAYADGDGRPRVRIEGEDATFDDQAATSVALLFHELATNAAKYGALSAPGGHVLLRTRKAGDRFVLTWTEVGGPEVSEIPARTGFGTSLATLSVEGQLGGRLERQWLPGGLVVEADLPATALSRRRAALKST
ncbi:sensor histidine kinase [Brevundimonas bacteroides]|uniref:sensor histidine kinase n=1 Tax=Brevundimonas bacteroides TaxID=74311 RepID=UPI0009FCB578|nr:PAS domain-containing protein [Brevundimonas bacteroides]